MIDISRQDIETLVKLQQAETEIVRLKSVLEEFEKEKSKIGTQLIKFSDALEKNKEELKAAETACSDIENEIQIVDARIIKSNENLRMVTTNKDYQVLLREVDDNKKRKDALETQLLEYIDEKERLEKIVQETQSEYDLLKSKTEAEQEQIDEKSTSDRAQLDEYTASQEEIGKTFDSGLMTLFNRISKMNGGLAVVQVRNEVCMGCFMNIPPQLYIEVQRGTKLISCPQCSRILHFRKE